MNDQSGGLAHRFLRRVQCALSAPIVGKRAILRLCIGSWAALLLAAPSHTVAQEPAPGQTPIPYFTGTGIINSFDWSAGGQLFYTEDNSYASGFYRVENGSRTEIKSFNKPGKSVAVLGDFIFLDGPEEAEGDAIFRYNIADGSCEMVSHSSSIKFYASANALLSFQGSTLSYLAIDSFGELQNTLWATLMDVYAETGPLVTDKGGNLYLAAASGAVYRWDAATVAAAIGGVTPLSIFSNNDKVSLGALSDGFEEISSIAVDENGDIYLALNYSDASSRILKRTQDGEEQVILFADNRLGELRLHDGSLFVASGHSILQITIPEPSTLAIVLLGLGAAAGVRRPWRRGRRVASQERFK